MKRILIFLALAIPTGLLSFAETPPEKIVTVSHRLSVDKARPGDSFQVAVILEMARGWHVQAAKPTFDYLVPTALTLTPEKGVTVGEVFYPKPTTSKVGDDTLDVLEGKAPLRFKVTLPANLPVGTHTLTGKLTYQPCDDQVCLAPKTVAVAIPFGVVAAGTPVTAINAEWFPTRPSTLNSQPSTPGDVASAFRERGTLSAFIVIFLIGLALNLTPCVYPMLSVTVSIFGAQTDTNPARVFLKATLYVLGIATMYSVLGTISALTGGLFGGLLQSRWVLVGIAVLFVALALSMFGLYEIRLPSSLMSKMGATTGAGLAGIYVSGLVVGIFAAPCAGPPVIGLLVEVAKRGDALFGFLSFFTLSLGLGAPYLVLGTFSGLLKKLPRSGVWMEWVKRVFGVALLGVALFYLALAFTPTLVKWVPALALLVGGCYLGFIERSGNDKKPFRNVKWAVGGLAALAGLAMIATEPRTTLSWEPYQPDKLAAAKAAGKPVILDFYADWCIPCHELDRKTFSHPDVMDALKDHVRLKVNLTSYDSPESESVRKQFGIQGVPTVILLAADGTELNGTRVIGFLSAERFLQQIRLSGRGGQSGRNGITDGDA
jgi:thiol:disulfide interchange protein DsbD